MHTVRGIGGRMNSPARAARAAHSGFRHGDPSADNRQAEVQALWVMRWPLGRLRRPLLIEAATVARLRMQGSEW